MFLEDLRIIKTKPTGGLAEALLGASNTNPGVLAIAPDYWGTDAVTDTPGALVWDLRSPVNTTTWADGSPAVVARVARTGIAANVGTTNFVPGTNIPVAGLYKVTVYLVNTSAFTTAGILATIGWTDAKQAQTLATSATAVAAGSYVQTSFIIQSSGTAQITYALSSTGTYGVASAFFSLERLA